MVGKDAEITVAITSDDKDLDQGLKKSQSKLASFGKSVAKIGLAAGIAAGAGIAVLAKQSVDAASAAQQSLGATETVFGKFADSIVKSSERAAGAVGLSANEYRESANKIGALLGNQGVAAKDLAGQTRKLVKQGADLAATFGGPTKDAVDALASAFKGELDPLEQYGISIKQSTINTEALAVANVKSTKEFNALSIAQQTAAKQQATMNLLQKQGSKSQNAFARETDTLAHQQQVLAANSENLKAKIGTALLPVVTKFFKYLNDEAAPVLNDLADRYLPTVTRALGNLVDGLGDPQKAASDLGSSLKGIDWKGAADTAGDLGASLKTIASGLKGVSLNTVSDGISVFGTVLEVAADHVDTLRKALPYLIAGFVAYKAAQLANNLVGRDSLVGFGLQLTATVAQTRANYALASSINTVTSAERGSVGSVDAATKGVSKLAAASKIAAGAGGVLALAAGAKEANGALATLELTAGGAAAGFAVGGPLGAAVGGLGGLMVGLVTKFDYTGQAAKDAYKQIAAIDPVKVASTNLTDLKDSLDQVTGAYTENTRAAVYNALQQSGAVASAEKYGISARELVNSVLGGRDAFKATAPILADYKRQIADVDAQQEALAANFENFDDSGFTKDAQARYNALEKQKKSLQTNVQELQQLPGALRGAQQEIRATTVVTQDFGRSLDSLPKGKRIKIEATGVVPTLKGIAQVARRLDLTPKEIRTVIKAVGVDTTVGEVQRVVTAMDNAKKDANASGSQVGSEFGSGVNSGIFGWIGDIAGAAAAVVRSAKAAARAEQHSNSPSRDTMKIGKDFADGYRIGIDSGRKASQKSGAALVRASLAGAKAVAVAVRQINFGVLPRDIGPVESQMISQLQSVTTKIDAWQDANSKRAVAAYQKQLNAEQAALTKSLKERGLKGKKLTDAIEKAQKKQGLTDARIDSLVSKKEKDRALADKKNRDRILGSLKDEYAALKKNGELQDRATAELAKQSDILQQMKDDAASYVASIKDAVVAYGDISKLGRNDDDETVSITKLLDDLKSKANDTQRFAELIRQLTAQGLDETSLQQLIAAGVEGGLSTAEALEAAFRIDPSVLAQIKAEQDKIVAAGGDLGQQMYDKFKKAGIDAQQGLVNGLISDTKELEAAAKVLADKLVKAIKKALGIRSPSRVFAEIGSQSVAGLTLGLDSTYASSAGRGLASALVNGFGQPQLAANAMTQNSGAMRVEVTLTAQQVSQLERGRAIQLDLDAYRSAGGRVRAT